MFLGGGSHRANIQGLFLVLHLGFTPAVALGTVWDAGNGTPVQGKRPTLPVVLLL